MKNKSFQLCNATIHPGEKLALALPLPELFSCAPLYMPITVIHGKARGPTLLLTAAIYGNELNGTQIINRLVHLSWMKRLRGTVIAIPVINVYGLINRARTLPGGIDLHDCFPGDPHGSHASRVAHLFSSEIFCHADYCINLETGFVNYKNFPQLHIDFKNIQEKRLAEHFNAPVIANTETTAGSLRALAHSQQIPLITYHAGEALRFDEYAIRSGVSGIINIMRHLEMLPPKKNPKEFKSFFTNENLWIRAATSGISSSAITLGQSIKKNQLICRIEDPFGVSTSTTITSPKDGIIVGVNSLPLVHEGEGLVQLAAFSEHENAAPYLEDWQENNKAALLNTHEGGG